MDHNDYLVLGRDREILKAEADALLAFGHNMMMSAVYAFGETQQEEFEDEMAAFLGAGSVHTMQSGYMANLAVMQLLGELNLPIYIDQYAHASLHIGAKMSKGPVVLVKHNDMGFLEEKLKQFGPGVIAVDSVYSTNGNAAPLDELVEIANDSILVVDESHALGVSGAGAGLVDDLCLQNEVHFRTASLSKAFVSRAGIIATGSEFSRLCKFANMGTIFSSAVMPHEFVGLRAVLKKVKMAGPKRSKILRLYDQLYSDLRERGVIDSPYGQNIVAVRARDDKALMSMARCLESLGVYGAPFFYPATTKNKPVMRLTINAGLTEKEIMEVGRALEVWNKVEDSPAAPGNERES